MENWIDNVKHQIKLLKIAHKLQRILLELSLETEQSNNSKYSNELVNLMKKEEALLKIEDVHSNAIKFTTDRVNDCIKNETKAFFNMKVCKSIKKWY